MNSLVFVCAVMVAAVVMGYPGSMDPMEGGPMNSTHDMDGMNMTGGPIGHAPPMNMTEGDHSEEEPPKHDRKRRGAVEELQNTGHDAVNTVETFGKDAWSKAGELGKSGLTAVENAGSSIKTAGEDVVHKVEEGI
ncbi:hypothetical protein GCK72_011509 [Caenorhabditis remanei]|uniref:Uncharacterized protein n=1 Tax=Caenorhabditis remanei TaxID=31234 RepID=A0A6A5H9Z6_CAERE|nr:hypothetical protein GCK72_011509 [Caenorhabditis remanei]KAF1763243.1 hypothetical protein GCK72_011509 [Caenorhabditis remanei]